MRNIKAGVGETGLEDRIYVAKDTAGCGLV
jgi:hypothetical protein